MEKGGAVPDLYTILCNVRDKCNLKLEHYCVFSLEIPSGLYSSLPLADVYCELCWKYITVSKADESMMI